MAAPTDDAAAPCNATAATTATSSTVIALLTMVEPLVHKPCRVMEPVENAANDACAMPSTKQSQGQAGTGCQRGG